MRPSAYPAFTLLLVLWTPVVSAYGPQVPNDGDSCHTFHYTDPWFVYFLRTFVGRVSFPCMDGTVVNSTGYCVRPDSPYADRCLDPETFSQTTAVEKCRSNPSAVFAHPLNCFQYYNCSVSYYEPQSCPYDAFHASIDYYDDVRKTCLPATIVSCGRRPVYYTQEQINAMCKADPTRIIANSTSCNAYYNCSQPDSTVSLLPPYGAECVYLELYDVETKVCMPYQNVNCMLRKEIKNPCSLSQYQCRVAHCRPCVLDHPDCTDLEDGDHSIKYKENTPNFVHCVDGRTMTVQTCPTQVSARSGKPVQQVFDPETKKCKTAETYEEQEDEDEDDEDDDDE